MPPLATDITTIPSRVRYVRLQGEDTYAPPPKKTFRNREKILTVPVFVLGSLGIHSDHAIYSTVIIFVRVRKKLYFLKLSLNVLLSQFDF
jgi:hypothetical protein